MAKKRKVTISRSSELEAVDEELEVAMSNLEDVNKRIDDVLIDQTDSSTTLSQQTSQDPPPESTEEEADASSEA